MNIIIVLRTCFLTRFAPLRNPCAEVARLSVLSWRESSLSPRCETLLIFSRMTPTVSSICYKIDKLALNAQIQRMICVEQVEPRKLVKLVK